ncbi:MAG: hypothetical protein KKA84_15520 [Bacteroidetes bacterium]|nr:hypothetical protein [Bacteroidota bacterium]
MLVDRNYIKKIFGLFLLFLIPSLMLAQEIDNPPKREKSLKKINSFADEAVGVQTKGQLQNLTMNYGQISDTRYEDKGNAPTDLFYDFRYPRENFTGLVDDFSFFFAVKENSKNDNQGNVIDAWTDNGNEDWIAKDAAYGRTHYNPALDPNPHEELLYNGSTPYLAHSDLINTWPVDENGVPFWPGIFRRDPDTGEQIEGEFASDRDIYMEFNDNNNQDGDVLGIEVHEMAYSYGRVYAENVLFYEFWIINKSGRDLSGCYTGFYQDPDCSDHTQEALLLKDSTFADGSKLFSIAQRDFDGDIGGATRPNALGIAEDYTFGTIVLETPYNMGITDFHYFVDPGPNDDHRLWPIITSDPTNRNIIAEVGTYFHGSNVRMDDVKQIVVPEDLAWTIAVGPFDIAAGDTVKLTCAAVVGDDDAHYYENVWSAKQLFDAYFNGPIAPPSPVLSAVPGDRKVTLYWDDTPESFIDPSSGEMDFEGYKIYKSEDGGVTWGTKITDSQGRTYGYVPVAQFDLKNNIKGNDSKNPLIYLGNDSGLQHSWVDENVINGIKYSYTIVAYDRGTSNLFSLEGTRGDGPQVNFFKTVTPSPVAQGYLSPSVRSLEQVSGTGDGLINIEVLDPNGLTDYTYEITIEGTPASAFSLKRNDASETVLYRSATVNDPNLAVVDGFVAGVVTDDRIGGLKSITDTEGSNVEGVNNISTDGSWYVTAGIFQNGDLTARSTSYSIIFSEEGGIAYSWGLSGSVASYNVPFYIINQKTEEKVCFELKDLNNDGGWNEGETIFITRVPYPAATPNIGDANPASAAVEFAYQVTIFNAPGDFVDNPPAVGTNILVNSYNGLRDGDSFSISFNQESFVADDVDLSNVRVVPNPYIVTSKYEALQNVREIKFMYLPPECTISVYTLSGTLVKTIYHDNGEGSLSWNLLTDWNQAMAFGVYVYVVEDPSGNKHIDKFALIK